MKSALELAVASQLDKDDFVQQQTNQVEGLGHSVSFVTDVRHDREYESKTGSDEGWFGMSLDAK